MYPLVGFASQAQRYVSKGRRFLSDAPFGRFSESLARRLPLEAAHAFGAYCRSTLSELGKVWAGFLLAGTFEAGIWFLGWIWGLPSWNLAFCGLLRLNLNSCGFLGLFVFYFMVVAYLPTNVLTLPARRLINTVSYHARRSSISNKEIPQEQSNRPNKQTSERTNEQTNELKNARAKKTNKHTNK